MQIRQWRRSIGKSCEPAGQCALHKLQGWIFREPIGSFAANAFGLSDLIKWAQDCFYGDYATAKLESACRLTEVCASRIVRGGDWFSTEQSLRPAVRAKADPGAHHDDSGFRVVRMLAP
jgi:formylglycine-generating enzyme required for sulfatase activity